MLIIIPYAFLELRPEATKAGLKRAQSWLLGHAQQFVAVVALLLGAYLTISAAVRCPDYRTRPPTAPGQRGFGRFTLFGGCFRGPRAVRSKVQVV